MKCLCVSRNQNNKHPSLVRLAPSQLLKLRYFLVLFLLSSFCGCSFMPERCKVHEVFMPVTKIRIAYGLPWRPMGYEEHARKEQFPNSRRYELGGCVVRSKKYRLRRYCSECREAEDKWRQAHKKAGRCSSCGHDSGEEKSEYCLQCHGKLRWNKP